MLAAFEFAFDSARLVNQHPAQAKASRSTLPKTQFDQPALTGEDFGREFPAVLPSHRALDTFDEGGDGGAIVFELLGNVGDVDVLALADVLVIRRFVRVLEPPPATDVVDQDQVEVGVAGFDIGDQALQRGAAVDGQTAFALVGVGSDDLDVAPLGVLANLVGLVVRGVLLMLGGHAHVLRSAKGGGRCGGGRWFGCGFGYCGHVFSALVR